MKVIRSTSKPEIITSAIVAAQTSVEYAILATQQRIEMLTKNMESITPFLGKVLGNLAYPLFKNSTF
jgi:hypothetical protein